MAVPSENRESPLTGPVVLRVVPTETGADPEPEHGEASGLPMCVDPPPRRPLPFGVRVTIFLTGWILILVGVAGLVLPGIQGIFTIVAGAALLSVDNEVMYRFLRRVLSRWPWVWHRVERFRSKAHERIHRFVHRGR